VRKESYKSIPSDDNEEDFNVSGEFDEKVSHPAGSSMRSIRNSGKGSFVPSNKNSSIHELNR